MFKKLKNLETAFQHVRGFTIAVVTCSCLLVGFSIWECRSLVATIQNRVYILFNGKVLEAFAADRHDNVAVEARDHVKTFHELFFTLSPDDKANQASIGKALYLADESAKRVYDNLSESGYYANIISGNISQELTVDSVHVDLSSYPYAFRCYAKQRIIRTTSIVTRSLITTGELRNVSRSDNNPHGFLIQRWTTIENKDLQIINR
ncbi:conjugative transposon protein TraK [Mucilaginibacter ginsenosidivorans]|uniref:Conjugative transposon protein TraK n=1 Tax=Mucilaginibacter ginsenosidivorans TaxID=398053 RepID=A0A5B8UTN5_9SPHI|nr:conjugative transposon protein TraK [Mucilaginibacter ginsenosidivorans]QEC62467.1 conjugative transposon protein TraK [Mucilaginibacter ginsenosidivorans]